jgi:hypothetical protein
MSMVKRVICFLVMHKRLTVPFTDPPQVACRRCGKAMIGSRENAHCEPQAYGAGGTNGGGYIGG